jgi:hypothetical protein
MRGDATTGPAEASAAELASQQPAVLAGHRAGAGREHHGEVGSSSDVEPDSDDEAAGAG